MRNNGTHAVQAPSQRQHEIIDQQRQALLSLLLETPVTQWQAAQLISDLIQLRLLMVNARTQRMAQAATK